MTPDQHAARAEALLTDPTIYAGNIERGLQAAQVHATLSLRGTEPPARPRPAPAPRRKNGPKPGPKKTTSTKEKDA
jgi:hypothetical protein